jgi:hypothetical protein
LTTWAGAFLLTLRNKKDNTWLVLPQLEVVLSALKEALFLTLFHKKT